MKSQKGFGAFGLLLTIVFLAIVCFGVFKIFDPIAQFDKMDDSRRKTNIAIIRKGLDGYYKNNGRYPANPSSTDYRIRNLSDGSAVSWGEPWQPYVSILPKDSGTRTYVYYAPDSNGQTYYIYASLKRGTSDPDSCNKGAACASLPKDENGNPVACGTQGEVCNYGVSSNNVSP